jgi:hypothetical protein
MLTTCPHCGTRSPASADVCKGCDRALYPLTAPPDPPPFTFRSRRNYVRIGITLGVITLLVGAGNVSGMLMARGDDSADDRGERVASEYKMVDTGASPDASPSTSPKKKPKSKSKKAGKDPAPQPSPSSSASSAPTKPKPPQKPGNGLPVGFHRVSDARGFSLAVMDGWLRRESTETQVDYLPPTGDEVLRIGMVPGAQQAPVANFVALEQTMSEGYERIKLEENTFQGHPGARWEFTYMSGSGEKMRVLDQAYIDENGTEYAIYFEVRDRLWDAQRDQVFKTALKTWKAPR